jgi:hypothetical protein
MEVTPVKLLNASSGKAHRKFQITKPRGRGRTAFRAAGGSGVFAYPRRGQRGPGRRVHTVIWGDPEGPAYFTFDKPSDQFGSFGDPRITAVGVELDQKLAALLEHLKVGVPETLLTS